MPYVTSRDGTRIAYETLGRGEPLILVDGALCYRGFGPLRELAERLQDRFEVLIYDRRGRGESGNTQPYAMEREVEDLEALLRALGGSAHLYGCSSGAVLALETANRLPGVRSLMLYEAPLIVDASREPMTDARVAEMDRLVAADRRSDAVKLFMRFVGMPRPVLAIMPLTRVWKKLTAVAHTLPHDFSIVGPYQRGTPLPVGQWCGFGGPVLVADGGKSPPWMREAQAALARHLGAAHRTLPGQTHMVKAAAHLPVIVDFFMPEVAAAA